ncbi:hypothetical protein [Amycolatopsis eburnea]|uniref:Uncharacterized protein n=1 Tax=Amycolatopsis eburnea TaxID=2267691 RepID=A0A3R9DSL1_9PSEU|nr:hypothetical protein [Amycolatopsis eburnea]RSD11529.1 hypothetical protein EIY87_32595 [Amycolatopsis eburnea]
MAITKGFGVEIAFDQACPQGLVMIGEVTADTEYQSREDRTAGRPARQRVDEVTGKRRWKATGTAPDETKAKRASFEIALLACVQLVPATSEALPGMRPIELEGLTAEPKVAGKGEFKYESYVFRATGFEAAGSGSKSARSATAGEAATKAA